MNITLCSAFRNSCAYIGRYFEQVAQLHDALHARGGPKGNPLNLLFGWGDSDDSTDALLMRLGRPLGATLVEYHHGGPVFDSVVHLSRFAQLAAVWNRIWERIPNDADAVLFVESDLIWQAGTMLTLLDRLADYPAIAPMILLRREPYPSYYWYDSWAFVKDGGHIANSPPYFDGWDLREPIRVDSAGSCLAIRGEIARQLYWPAEDVVVGVCRQIREQYGSVWLDPAAEVYHT